MASDTVGQLKIALTFDTKELNSSMESAQASADKAGNAMSVAFGTLAANAVQTVIGKVGELASSVVKTGMGFEASMSNVAAISGATGDDIAALTSKAREMGANTKFSASQAADALSYMAMAGWKTDQMLDGLDGIMQLAAASGSDLATTSDIVTDALTAFGQSAAESGRLADIMAAASSNSNTNVELLGETFKYVAPVAGALGYSMEDTATAIGLMANAGIKGGQAGTALRTILTNLANPTKTMAAAMDDLGISITDASGNMKPMSQLTNELRDAFAGLSESEQAEYAASIAGKEGMSGLLAIVNAAPEDYNKLSDAISNSNGAAEEMAATMQDNLQGRLTNLNSKFEELQIQLFDAVKPALEAGVGALNTLADAGSWVLSHLDVIIPVLGALTADITAYVAVTKGAAIASKLWTTATNVAKAAQMALNAVLNANPIGIIIAAVTALITGLVLLYKNCEPFREFVNTVFGKIGEFFGWIGEKLEWIGMWIGILAEAAGMAFGEIGANIGAFFETVGNVVGQIVGNIVGFFAGMWETISGIFSAVGEFLANIFAVPIAIISKLIEIIMKIGEIIGVVVYTIVAVAVQFFIDIFQNVWDFIWGGITAVGEWFSGLWNGLMEALTAVGEFFFNIFQGVWDAISGVVENVKNAFQGAWDFITGIFSKVGQWFKDRFTEVYNNIKTVFNNVIEFFKGIWDGIVNIFVSIGEAVGNGVKNALATAINFVLQAIETVINWGIDFINGLIAAVNAIADVVGIHIDPIEHIYLGRVEFAKGGIVPGDDYYGDHVPAMMNSGEMVLTRGQQSALWNAIESGDFSQSTPAMPEPAIADVDVWAKALAQAFADEEINGEPEERVQNVTMYNEINSKLDAEEIGNIMLESIRRAA